MTDDHVQRLASEALAAGDPTGWFERLYAAAADGAVPVPWDRGGPRDVLVDWVRTGEVTGHGRSAVVVGCGLGADAEYLAGLGFDTVAFDVSPTAVQLARSRHPGSAVRYTTANLLALPLDWMRSFDLVVESLTVQALPRSVRAEATVALVDLVADGGTLLLIAGVLPAGADPDEGPPWRLSAADVDAFAIGQVRAERIEVLRDADDKLRWRAEFRRPLIRR
jgi:SAM-dependent methyltransferase